MINGSTQFLVIFGDPVSHSLSPAMHNAAFETLGWNYRYIPCHVTPDKLPDAIRGLRALGFLGGNMTIPHKQTVAPLLDEVFGDANQSGSLNTVINRNGKLYGTSTDGIGLVRSLKEEGKFDLYGKRILILGAGGAAASIVFSLIASGVKSMEIINRSFSKAISLQEKIRVETGFEVTARGINDLAGIDFTNIDLIVNTTSVGLHDDETVLPGNLLKPHIFVYDAVYKKGGTRLVKDATTIGCKVLSGLSMLLYQGAASFTLWFETDPPINIMREVIFRGDKENVSS